MLPSSRDAGGTGVGVDGHRFSNVLNAANNRLEVLILIFRKEIELFQLHRHFLSNIPSLGISKGLLQRLLSLA